MTGDLWRSLVVVREVWDPAAGYAFAVEIPSWRPGLLVWLPRKERERAEAAIGQPFTVGTYLLADVNLGARTAASLRFEHWELAAEPAGEGT